MNHEEQIRNSINQVNDEANRVRILKATKVFMVIVGLYVVTWIPFIIINTLMFFCGNHCVFIDSGHYVSYIRQSNKWYHCDDKHITETNLLTLSNNVYLMFYAKEVDLGT